jgi:hypothetical protein
MSADLKVFIEKSKLPTREEWTKAIAEHGFDLEFHEEFNSNEMQGFLPCKLQGQDVGFEYYNDVLEDTMFNPDSTPEIDGKDICISFSSSYEQGDLSSAMIAAGALVKLANGVYWVMEGFELNEDPIKMAQHVLENGLG